VAWDWWNAWNVYGLISNGGDTQTYKYYIDFAANTAFRTLFWMRGWYKLGMCWSGAGSDMRS